MPDACVIPFTYTVDDRTYSSCVNHVAVDGQHDGNIPWCATNTAGPYSGGSAWLHCILGKYLDMQDIFLN